MKASDLFVQCLEREGIEYIFGVTGEENADFVHSLKHSDQIRFVLTRHEQGAAFMAEAYGKLTGNPAICLGTLGPGATNLITGVADADMDHAPLIVLTGQGATTRQHKESHQVMDVVQMYEPVTKWAQSVHHPDSIPEIVRKSVRTARGEKPGAVHIELAENIAKMETDVRPMEPRRFRRPGVDDKVSDQAYELIRNARAPIIIAGNGAVRKRASNQLRRLAEQTGIPVTTTFMGKGAVDFEADYALYTIGLGQWDHVADAVRDADVVITVGYDLVEYPPQLWNPDATETIVHIDFDPAEIDREYHPAVELVGDVAHALWQLNRRFERDGAPAYDFSVQQAARARMKADMEEHAEDDTEGIIRPQKAIWDVRQVLGPDDVVLSGVGAHKMWLGRHYHCHEPNTCLIPNGFCSMGMPLPGAIGAALVADGRRIVGIAGDGDFMMNVQEMETAKRLDSDITMLVWEDGGYGLISWKQDDHFGSHTDLEFGNPDWLHLAEAFGWHGQYVNNARDLRGALQNALDHEGPSLVVIPIDYSENQKLSKRLGVFTGE
ncbi:acetolactate synthase large subunit [Halofilum ochraceum]|uniref:acetolactate synthase large subunit n=1 Tax=Halofilum ochraceum TaxID=1611323 RepID=UPI00082AC297|nr:acetolactate synthase large subunit [Halofilum ochraceum]